MAASDEPRADRCRPNTQGWIKQRARLGNGTMGSDVTREFSETPPRALARTNLLRRCVSLERTAIGSERDLFFQFREFTTQAVGTKSAQTMSQPHSVRIRRSTRANTLHWRDAACGYFWPARRFPFFQRNRRLVDQFVRDTELTLALARCAPKLDLDYAHVDLFSLVLRGSTLALSIS